MRKGLISVGVLALAFQVAGCRERTAPSSALKGDVGDDNSEIVGMLDATCAEAGCHESENHQLSKAILIQFADQSKKVSDCLNSAENDTPEKKTNNCFRQGGTAFNRGLGVYRAMVKDESLASIVAASGASEAQKKQFAKLIMPPGVDENAFGSAEAWARVKDWLVAQPGMNYAGINAARPSGEAEGKDCEERISPELTAHVQAMQAKDAPTWAKVHRDNKMPMFGCPEKTDWPKDPMACLTKFTDRGEWATKNVVEGQPQHKLRLLRSMPGFTSFWTRTSPDGRFVGNGGAPDETRNEKDRRGKRPKGEDDDGDIDDFSFNAAVDDLAVKDRRILVTASYDPAFSPDGSKYMFVGTICPMQPLKNTATKRVKTDDKASGCFDDGEIQTYQSIGQETGAGDSFTVIHPGNYRVDNSGGSPDGAADPLFVPNNDVVIHTYTKDASGAFKAQLVSAPTPAESQSSLSVTSKLLVQRFSPRDPQDDNFFGGGGDDEDGPVVFPPPPGGGGDAVQPGDGAVLPDDSLVPEGGTGGTGNTGGFALQGGDDDFAKLIKKTGYRVRFVDRMRTAGANYDAKGDTTASEICMKGNKTMMSYDDRFIATHHAIDKADDPANAGKHSDIWVYDLLRKKAVQVTKTPPGVFALYPHFRADGWLYFLVREWDAAGSVRKDHIMATDVALLLAK